MRNLVAVSEGLVSHWKSNDNPFLEFFVSFSPGVLRTYPGLYINSSDKAFPAYHQEAWYRRAEAEPDKTILTGPAVGIAGTGPALITVSRAFAQSTLRLEFSLFQL